MPLRLRPLRLEDYDAAMDAHRAMLTEDFTLLLGWSEGLDWSEYLRSIDENSRSTTVSVERVPASVLVAEVDGVIVGRASIRFALNDWLALRGGHIGYCVLREHRRRGYATEILRQALIIARSHGVERVLVTCDDTNLASAAVIERCGAILERVVPPSDGDVQFRRYWIE